MMLCTIPILRHKAKNCYRIMFIMYTRYVRKYYFKLAFARDPLFTHKGGVDP